MSDTRREPEFCLENQNIIVFCNASERKSLGQLPISPISSARFRCTALDLAGAMHFETAETVRLLSFHLLQRINY